MNPNPKETILLSMGDELRVYEDSIMIGPVDVSFGRPIKQIDVENIITVYTIGMAARSRMINAIWSTFMDSINDVKIMGYTDKGGYDPCR